MSGFDSLADAVIAFRRMTERVAEEHRNPLSIIQIDDDLGDADVLNLREEFLRSLTTPAAMLMSGTPRRESAAPLKETLNEVPTVAGEFGRKLDV